VLSDEQLRRQYDKFGKESAVPSSGFGMRTWLPHAARQTANSPAEDPAEFFTMIFGGEAFVDW
jgi:DnaJ-class molecular chaperone